MVKKSMGRQKIEIKKIENEESLQVCFSKRRGGLFKKASELCILCGAEIGIVVFSPAGKVFSFGHPCVESIINRFIAHDVPSNALVNMSEGPHRAATVRELNRQCTELLNQVEAEKKRGESLKQMVRAGVAGSGRPQVWWEAPVEEMGMNELEQYKACMEELRKEVVKRANEMMMRTMAAQATPFLGVNPAGVINHYAPKSSDHLPPLHHIGFGRHLF